MKDYITPHPRYARPLPQGERHKVNYDLIIHGLGLIGASLAWSIRHLPLRIAIIDHHPAYHLDDQARLDIQQDNRILALSAGTQHIFQQLELWHHLEKYTTSIHSLHVSQHHHWPKLRTQAQEYGIDALGYTISFSALFDTLYRQLMKQNNQQAQYDFFWETQLKNYRFNGINLLTIQHQNQTQTISSELVVATDGTHSQLAQQANFDYRSTDYQQTAIVCLTEIHEHHHCAYERFTEEGAIALLPVQQNHMAVVWVNSTHKTNELLKLDEVDFARALAAITQPLDIRFTHIQPHQHYPMQLRYTNPVIKPGVIVLGNAAQTLHAIAAQGFNLGLRDVWELAQLLQTAHQQKQFLSDPALLLHYNAHRKWDRNLTIQWTNQLAKHANHFCNDQILLPLGIAAASFLPAFKQTALRKAMGLPL